jgi:DNA-binding Xre family transcriptional regulator
MNKRYIGSNFDEFLEKEGLLAEVEAVAVKRVIAYQIGQLMESSKITKTTMAKRMKTSRAALERLLDPENGSVTLQTLERAALALGKRLQIELINFSQPKRNVVTNTKRGANKKMERTGKADA